MARTYVDIEFKGSQKDVDEVVRSILIDANYREINYNREIAWKMGTGLMTAMHYIKVEYINNVLHLSGWIQVGVGSLGGKERDLTGYVGIVPKKSVLSTIDRIKLYIHRMNAGETVNLPRNPAASQYAAAPQPAAPQSAPPAQAAAPSPAPAQPSGQMTFIYCTHCGTKLQVPVGLKLRVTCPKCGGVFDYQG